MGIKLALGARASYRFKKYLGFNVSPALNVGLPNLLLAIDVTGGLEAAF